MDLKIISRLLKLGRSSQIFTLGDISIFDVILSILLFVFSVEAMYGMIFFFLSSTEHTADQSRHC